MIKQTPGGGFMVARKIFTSEIWSKDPLYLKLWLWIIGRANWKDYEKNGHIYKRGEVVTSYREIIDALTYFHNKRKTAPTIKKVRILLHWLESEDMICINPLHSGRCRAGADPTTHTRAYLGIKIIVVNYDIYQDSENYKDRDKGKDFSEQGHNIEKKHIEKKQKGASVFSEIKSFRQQYSDQNLLDQCFAAIASTRKSGKVADSVLLAQLQKWDRFPAEQVEAGIRTYLAKDYASQGKGENYLFGIIRNHNGDGHPQQSQHPEPPQPKFYSANDPESLKELYSNG